MSAIRLLGAITIGAALAAAAAHPGFAQPAAKSAGQCFLADDVNGFNAPDDHTLYIKVGVSDVYRLDLMGDCQGLRFREGIGLERTPASAWICSPLDATVVYHETGMAERCPVTAIHKLTKAEIEALPKRDRP